MTKVDISEKTQRVLEDNWDQRELQEGLKDPVKFIREVVNPHFRAVREKNPATPIIFIKGGSNSEVIRLILSTEEN